MSENRNHYETVTNRPVSPSALPFKKKGEQEECSSGGGGTGTGTTTTRARAILEENEKLTPEYCEYLEELYQECFNVPMPFVVARYIMRLNRGGMCLEMFEYAMTETMLAMRPSPRYMMAILDRWWRQKILNGEQYYKDREMHEAHMERRRADRWSQILDSPEERAMMHENDLWGF